MSEPFLAEIRIMAFGFVPRGWALCNGQLLPINQNTALFALLGTTYGGNGTTNFALPDLRGRIPIHFGAGFVLGQSGGTETHTLLPNEMPAHSHTLFASPDPAVSRTPAAQVLARTANPSYASGSGATLSADTLANAGGSQPHANVQPSLVLNYVIALQGIFPSQN
jgi:microcystin-dependent protein